MTFGMSARAFHFAAFFILFASVAHANVVRPYREHLADLSWVLLGPIFLRSAIASALLPSPQLRDRLLIPFAASFWVVLLWVQAVALFRFSSFEVVGWCVAIPMVILESLLLDRWIRGSSTTWKTRLQCLLVLGCASLAALELGFVLAQGYLTSLSLL
jgi:hypothetical protein